MLRLLPVSVVTPPPSYLCNTVQLLRNTITTGLKMYRLKPLLLMVFHILYSINADVIPQGAQLMYSYSVPFNRLALKPVIKGSACVSEGRLADPDDSSHYYDCVRGKDGVLIANKQSCLGHVFDARSKSCVSASLAPGGSTNILRSFPPRAVPVDHEDTSLQTICKSNDNEFICLDCKTLIMCVDRVPYKIPCKTGNVCYNDKEQFNGGVCYPDEPVECTCKSDEIFKQDFYDSSKFLTCDSKDADPEVHSCPDGLEFDNERRACGTPKDDTSCSEVGTFSQKSNCRHYHTCIYTTSGWFQRNFTCDGNTMYNEEAGRCEDPCDWNTGDFVCKEEGRFPNQRDCTSFFECIIDPSDSNNFLQTEYVCPEGYEWLPLVNRHHCVAIGSSLSRCEVQKPSVCQIPDGWCPSKADSQSTPPKATSTTSSPANPNEFDCNGAGGTMIGDQCLTLSDESVTCGEAATACSSIGGSLASITDSEAVLAHIQSNGGTSATYWIGTSAFLRGRSSDLQLFIMAVKNDPQFFYHTCDQTMGYICEIGTSPPVVAVAVSSPAPSPPASSPTSTQAPTSSPQAASTVAASVTAAPSQDAASTLATKAPVNTRGSCPQGHFQVGSQCFFIPTAGFQTWYGAQELCKAHGGFLAEPDSIPEFHTELSKQTSDYGFWLGGSTRKHGRSGQWYWSTRGAMVGNSESWYIGGPNLADTSDKCLFLMRGMQQPLAARSCAVEHHYFVCERY